MLQYKTIRLVNAVVLQCTRYLIHSYNKLSISRWIWFLRTHRQKWWHGDADGLRPDRPEYTRDNDSFQLTHIHIQDLQRSGYRFINRKCYRLNTVYILVLVHEFIAIHAWSRVHLWYLVMCVLCFILNGIVRLKGTRASRVDGISNQNHINSIHR